MCFDFRTKIFYCSFDEEGVIQLKCDDIRPRARMSFKLEELTPGMTVMANFNYDDRNERGYWYDVEITRIRNTRTIKEVIGMILIG